MSDEKWYETHVAHKVATWVCFNVAVALSPFLFGIMQLINRNAAVSGQALFGSGQLFLVSTAIAAGATGELVLAEVPRTLKLAKLLVIFGCVASLLVSSLWFADAASTLGEIPGANGADSGNHSKPNGNIISNWSWLIFGSTFLTGLACIWMAAATDGKKIALAELLSKATAPIEAAEKPHGT
ncbi:MAG TPA: hypothetical protein VN408_28430 [Actinoplanes sp.]|nr:hypothetical protein [Actinoplanes sp.]